MPGIKHEGEKKSISVCWRCFRQLDLWKERAGSHCGRPRAHTVCTCHGCPHTQSPSGMLVIHRCCSALVTEAAQPRHGSKTQAPSEFALLFPEELLSPYQFEKLTGRNVSYVMKCAFYDLTLAGEKRHIYLFPFLFSFWSRIFLGSWIGLELTM